MALMAALLFWVLSLLEIKLTTHKVKKAIEKAIRMHYLPTSLTGE